jgi:hypothetical protein
MNSTFQNNPLVDNGIITVPAANDPAWLPGRRNWIPPYAIIFQILTTFLLALRLGSRLNKGGGRLGIDDAFISLAWVLGFTITILVIYGKLEQNTLYIVSVTYARFWPQAPRL